MEQVAEGENMNTSAPLIEAKKLTVIRQGKTILDKVSFEVHAGDFITVVGPNGAGKSMLLKAFLGIYAPDKGRVVRKDGLRIGYMPQRMSVEPTMPITVRRFLQLVRSARERSIEEKLALVEAPKVIDSMLYDLSGGELQRVLLARALLHEPELLVLDEPAQNLDIGGEVKFYKLLDKIYQLQQCAILMVSHDLHLVMASTKQVICLYHHICCSGEPQTIAKDPQFISLFGKDMNELMAIYEHQHDHRHG